MFFICLILSNVVISSLVDSSTISIQINLEHSFLNLIVFVNTPADSHQLFGSFLEEATSDEIAIDDISFELKSGSVDVELLGGAVFQNLTDCQPIEILPFGDSSVRELFWLAIQNFLKLLAVQEELFDFIYSLLFFFFQLFLNFFQCECLCLHSLDICALPAHFDLNLLQNGVLQLLLSLLNGLNLSLNSVNRIHFDPLFNAPDLLDVLAEPRLDPALLTLEPLHLLLVLLLDLARELLCDFQILAFQGVN